MTNGPLSSGGPRLFAIGGGVAFAASLAYCAYAYAWRFGAVASSPPLAPAPLAIDVLLFAAFAAHHSVFARSGLKAHLRRYVPAGVDRSLYVWIASALFVLVMWGWRPVGGVAWRVEGPGAWILRALQIGGVVLAFLAGRLFDALDLAGVRDALGRPWHETAAAPVSRGPYGVVRHPLYLAWLVLIWAVPVMTGTRLLFALLNTAYLTIAIRLEERDLRAAFGPAYDRYRQQVRYRLVPGVF